MYLVIGRCIKKKRRVIKIKYMGSKSRIAKYIVPIIQQCIDDNNITRYIEPFVGGANIIDKINCEHRIGLDKNKYLIALFRHLQQGGKLLDEVPRELYNEVRANYKNGKYEDWFVGNIGFLASYNGRWFDGGYAQAGYEKTKTGERFRDYYQEAKRNIETQIISCKDIIFGVSCYKQIKFSDDCKDIVYCDPPYQNAKQFANGIDFDYEYFWELMREWSKNQYVLVSELQAPEDFEVIWSKPVSRSIKSTDKSFAVEKLFTYKEGRYSKYIKNRGDANA